MWVVVTCVKVVVTCVRCGDMCEGWGDLCEGWGDLCDGKRHCSCGSVEFVGFMWVWLIGVVDVGVAHKWWSYVAMREGGNISI